MYLKLCLLLCRLLGRTDWFSQSKACKLLTAVFESRPEKDGENFSTVRVLSCRLLGRTDWFSQTKACKLLTAAFESQPEPKSAVVQAAGENRLVLSVQSLQAADGRV